MGLKPPLQVVRKTPFYFIVYLKTSFSKRSGLVYPLPPLPPDMEQPPLLKNLRLAPAKEKFCVAAWCMTDQGLPFLTKINGI